MTEEPKEITEDLVEESLASRAGRLFAEYRAGDDHQMGTLVGLLTPILWHTVRAMRLDTATSEDVLQSVWLALVRSADSIAEPQAILQWMIISAKREAWRVARAQARVQPRAIEAASRAEPDGQVERHRPTTVEEEVMRSDTEAKLWKHIAALPERCRRLLRVIAFADRPDYAMVAVALGMPQGSIGPTRGRCLAKLRISLAGDSSFELDQSGGLS